MRTLITVVVGLVLGVGVLLMVNWLMDTSPWSNRPESGPALEARDYLLPP